MCIIILSNYQIQRPQTSCLFILEVCRLVARADAVELDVSGNPEVFAVDLVLGSAVARVDVDASRQTRVDVQLRSNLPLLTVAEPGVGGSGLAVR